MLHKPIASPKRNGTRRDQDLYYYYAAFAQSFVDQKILELNLSKGALILDPWCGSGTTLASARRLGYPYFGCDINPVSVVLTKSRFASQDDVAYVAAELQKTIRAIAKSSLSRRRPERLLWTLRDKLIDNDCHRRWAVDRYRSMNSRTALLLASLFFFARRAVREARSKNPSWRMRNSTPQLSMQELHESYRNLMAAFDIFSDEVVASTTPFDVAVIDNERETFATEAFADAVITSPPYLTRIDYGNSTGIEWRLLNGDPDSDLREWRASFTGSVLTTRTPTAIMSLPASVGRVLEQIHAHRSKAARTYYFQFFRNYFVGIQNALVNISSATKPGASGFFVVQDSQFKDINISLTELFADMLAGCGWSIERTEAFSISPTFYKINPKRWSTEDFVRSENVILARRVR